MKKISRITALFCVLALLFTAVPVKAFAQAGTTAVTAVSAETVYGTFNAGFLVQELLDNANKVYPKVKVYMSDNSEAECGVRWTKVDEKYDSNSNKEQIITITGEIGQLPSGVVKGEKFDGTALMEAKIVPKAEFSYIEEPTPIEFILGIEESELIKKAGDAIKYVRVFDNNKVYYDCSVRNWEIDGTYDKSSLSQVWLVGDVDIPDSLYVSESADTKARLRMVPIQKDLTVFTPYTNVTYDKAITVDHNLEIPLICDTPGAQIYYTLDNTTPTTSSKKYSKPIPVTGKPGESVTVTIRAIADKKGLQTSSEFSLTCTVELPKYFIERIKMYSSPSNTYFEKGTPLNLTGARIRVYYEDNTSEIINVTEDMVSGYDPWVVGNQTITVTYGSAETTFNVRVRSSGYSDDNYNANDSRPSYSYDDETSETPETLETPSYDNPPSISNRYSDWDSIESALSTYSNGSTIFINLNDATFVPADVINAAARNNLILVIKVDNELSWRLDTHSFNSAKSNMSAAVRKKSIYIPQVLISEVGESEAVRFHIGDNKLKAELLVTTSANRKKFVNLYMYDSESQTLKFVDCDKISSDGVSSLMPVYAGDYVAVVDNETKLPGDMDNSTDITADDALILFEMLSKGKVHDLKADYNGDGVVNAIDVSLMLRKGGN